MAPSARRLELGGSRSNHHRGTFFGAGGEIGLKAEVGLHWGPTISVAADHDQRSKSDGGSDIVRDQRSEWHCSLPVRGAKMGRSTTSSESGGRG